MLYAVFCGVGVVRRGNIINDESLIGALDRQWLSSAWLDVFVVEPLPKTR